VEEKEPALLLAHASIELSPAVSAAAALLHLDEPRTHALLDDDSSNDKTDGWCLNTGATHHMTDRRKFFTELDFDVRGSVKFGDASGVEIKGVGSVIFAVESDEHRLLTGVYYIPALRNSIISLGQLNESGSRVEIKDEVMRIWDRHQRLLAKVTRGTNQLYVLNVQVAQPLCLAARRDDEAWQWHECFRHLHFEALKRLSAKGMVRGLPIPGKEGKVLRLRKTLYGLRQAPRAWNAKLDSTLKGMGFGQSPHEVAIYRRGNGGNTLLGGCLRRRLDDHRHQGGGGGSVQGRDEGHLPDE
jgi:hypothetical protein